MSDPFTFFKFAAYRLHSIYRHQRRENVPYAMRVTVEYRDSLDRQVAKIVNISTFSGAVLINRKNEMGVVRAERQQYRRWTAAD